MQNPTHGGVSAQSKSDNLILTGTSTEKQYPRRTPQQLSFFEKLEPAAALRTESVPDHLAVGTGERFSLIHCETGLYVPGQFSQPEADFILKTTSGWDWAVDPKTRIPACNRYLLALLEEVCLPKKSAGVAA